MDLFWRDALGWRLVWDQGQETAIQSPLGGTKVAWGGPPVPEKRWRNPQRLELGAGAADHATEIERLVGLGATVLAADEDDTVMMLDPDGNEFSVTLH